MTPEEISRTPLCVESNILHMAELIATMASQLGTSPRSSHYRAISEALRDDAANVASECLDQCPDGPIRDEDVQEGCVDIQLNYGPTTCYIGHHDVSKGREWLNHRGDSLYVELYDVMPDAESNSSCHYDQIVAVFSRRMRARIALGEVRVYFNDVLIRPGNEYDYVETT
jgi:hypothetical protein